MYVCFIKHKIILCVLNPQTISTKLFTIPLTRGYCRRRSSKSNKVTLIELSIGSYIFLESNKTPSGTPSGPGSKIKALPEEKSDD